MAIQIRRGTDSQWESNKSNIIAGEPAIATDSKRAFIGTANGAFMELANNDSIIALAPYNANDLLMQNNSGINGTHNYVSYTFSGNSCKVVGTASGSSFRNIYADFSTMPKGIVAGNTYYFKYTTPNTGIRLAIFMRDSQGQAVGSTNYLTSDRNILIPSNVVGMTIRIDVANGTSTNDTVTFAILDTLTNQELVNKTSTLISAKDPSKYVTNSTITLSDIIEDGFYAISNNWTVTDAPSGLTVTGLTVEKFSTIYSGGFVKQIAESTIQPAASKRFYRFSNYNGTSWSNWVEVTASNDYIFNHYENTYNVTATPTITTDTNNFLASTGDSTDVTNSIETLLTQNGVCHLGAGVFYVSGVNMPNDTALIGNGASTIVILSGSSDGYAVKMGNRCKVSDMTIMGASSNITLSSTVGNRHGILWEGNYTQSQSATDQPQMGIIDSVYIHRFSGGGITCYDTGYGTFNHLEVSNVYVWNCNAGVNISYWSEYHKFINVRTYACWFGCINNGGNNIFVNCDFSTCKQAFLMDNSSNQSPNNSHGSAIGCIFNHTNDNSGIGIQILNCDNGFVFSGCQIFFSQIDIENSEGIVVSDCNFGSTNCDITITGGGAILFSNNMHQAQPTITISNNSNVHFINSYVRSTGAVISA